MVLLMAAEKKNMVTSKFDVSIFKLIYESCVVEIQTLYQN